MKKTFLAFAILVLATFAKSQDEAKTNITEGTIYYEQVDKLDIKLEGDAAQYAHALPKERRSKKLLHFNQEASLFTNNKDTDNEHITNTGSEGMTIKMMEPENRIYTDLKTNKQIEQREFMTRTFLIERELEKSKWKLTGKRKTILNYQCQQALLEKEDKQITAWFAPSIPISAGPQKFNGLPGLILALDIDNGKHTIVAKSIDTNTLSKNIIEKPKKGKKVNDEEFKKIVGEKMKEMGTEGGEAGGQRIIIRIRN